MYYNSCKNNNDYYNSYKKQISELEAYRKEKILQSIIKFFLLFLLVLLFILGSYYLYTYFYPTINVQKSISKNSKVLVQNKPLGKITIREEELPKFNTPIKSNNKVLTSLNEKDIALIVQIIMTQLNTKKEIPLEQQLVEASQKKFTTKNLKNNNHYNKIILTHNETVNIQNNSLLQLANSLKHIIEDDTEDKPNSNYVKAIKKEVSIRKNEMRVIIVQKGDTLSKIAKKAYGDSHDYKKIFSANPEIIKNPNQIFVGQRLRIPV